MVTISQTISEKSQSHIARDESNKQIFYNTRKTNAVNITLFLLKAILQLRNLSVKIIEKYTNDKVILGIGSRT